MTDLPRAAPPPPVQHKCDAPEVAVCIVGQLRTASRLSISSQLRRAWDNVGQGCADVFVDVGNDNHTRFMSRMHTYSEIPQDSMASAIKMLKPVSWRISISESTAWPQCSVSGTTTHVCNKGHDFDQCMDDRCTHCRRNDIFPYVRRIARCASSVLASGRSGYSWFAFHRPDMYLWGVPNIATWRRLRNETDAVYFCGEGFGMSDGFQVLPIELVPLLAHKLERHIISCSARADFANISTCNVAQHWASPECAFMHMYEAEHLKIRSMTKRKRLLMRSSACRILRPSLLKPQGKDSVATV